jgi:hypothetical protein
VFGGPAGVAEQEGINKAVAAYGQFQGLAGAIGIEGLDIAADDDGEHYAVAAVCLHLLAKSKVCVRCVLSGVTIVPEGVRSSAVRHTCMLATCNSLLYVSRSAHMLLTGDRKLQVQPVFSGPAGEAEQEAYKQFAAVETQSLCHIQCCCARWH